MFHFTHSGINRYKFNWNVTKVTIIDIYIHTENLCFFSVRSHFVCVFKVSTKKYNIYFNHLAIGFYWINKFYFVLVVIVSNWGNANSPRPIDRQACRTVKNIFKHIYRRYEPDTNVNEHKMATDLWVNLWVINCIPSVLNFCSKLPFLRFNVEISMCWDLI